MEDKKRETEKGKKKKKKSETQRSKKVLGKRTPGSSETLHTLKSFVFCLTTLYQEKIDGR